MNPPVRILTFLYLTLYGPLTVYFSVESHVSAHFKELTLSLIIRQELYKIWEAHKTFNFYVCDIFDEVFCNKITV